jgi:long-subunit fatty acid transport protein
MKKFLTIIFLLTSISAAAQEDRIKDPNFINWVQSINKISINDKFSLHLEYQLRRTDGLTSPQQNLLRLGLNYHVHENITFHGGYAWVATYPYGDYPIASNGTFPEHRTYQQFAIKQVVSKWSMQHRFRLEQRWLAKLAANTADIEDWVFLNRFRYQFRLQYPLKLSKKTSINLIAWDEIFIGSGKNLGTNIFDQNRLALQIGWKITKNYQIEFGYLNQILQQGKRLEGKAVIQHNEGFVLSGFLNL